MAGERIITDYQYEFNGLLVGVHTPYDIEEIEGLHDMEVRSGTVEAFGRHGDIPGRHYAQSKSITFQGNFLAESDEHFAYLRQELARAFAPIVDQRSHLPLVYRHPGGQLVRINCRPTRRSVPINRGFALKYPRWIVRLEAADPFIYGNNEKVVTLTVPSSTDGMTHPLTFPLSFGSGSAGATSVRNAGNAPAPWEAFITGPAVNPTILNDETGQRLQLQNTTITAHEALHFDSYRGTIFLNGTSDRSGSIVVGSEWWDFKPGDTGVRFYSDSATELTSLIIRWRDTYWSD